MTRNAALQERPLGRRARPRREARKGLVRRIAARFTAVVAMVGVAAFVVSVSVPIR